MIFTIQLYFKAAFVSSAKTQMAKREYVATKESVKMVFLLIWPRTYDRIIYNETEIIFCDDDFSCDVFVR